MDQTRKRKNQINDDVKKKKKSSFSPWWDHRKASLSAYFTQHSNCSSINKKFAWIEKKKHDNSSTSFEFESYKDVQKPKEKKKTTKLSKEETSEDETIRSWKIRIIPTLKQKQVFQKIFGVTRFVYNKAIDFVNAGHKPNFKTLKSQILDPRKNQESEQYKWLFEKGEVPRDAKDMAVHELCSAIATTKESLKANKKAIKFEMKPREKKDRYQRFKIPNNGGKPAIKWGEEGFFFWARMKLGEVKCSDKKDLESIKSLCGEEGCWKTVTVKYESPGNYYMIFPFVKKKQILDKKRKVIALDPGVRTFQTGYDPNGRYLEYGAGSIDAIMKKCLFLDKLQAKISKYNKPKYENKEERLQYKNQRKRWRNQMTLIQRRIENQLKDLHWKISKDLTSHYNHILISRFKVSDMVERIKRKISSETVRKMLNWRHFLFRQRLKSKAEEVGSHIHEVSEHYTSKTCGSCGKLHWKLGSSKTFQCPFCPFKMDRDWNGARNIFLMNVEEFVGKIEISSSDG